MDDPDPQPPNPFEGLPFFGDMARMLQSQGPLSWEVARQVALGVATGGTSEANVDPLARVRYEELMRVAELHVGEVTGLATGTDGRTVKVDAVTRSQWAHHSLEAYKPLLERLAGALGQHGPEGDDPMLGGLLKMIGPAMLGVQAGTMVGHLATRAFGSYDLPIPRPVANPLLIVPPNVEAFAEEWSLEPDDLGMWICVHEVAVHTLLSRPHVHSALHDAILDYVGAFDTSSDAIEQRLSGLDPADPASLQQLLGDPGALLGMMQSDAQRAMLPRLEALIAAVVGYTDHVMARVTPRLLSSASMLTEALHRRRVEATQADRFVQRLLGFDVNERVYERGQAFIDGVIGRAGDDALHQLWTAPRALPTPAEIEAPGLWLARLELPDDPGDPQPPGDDLG